MLYLLDTDHISFWQKATTEGGRVRERVLRLPPDDYGISIITYAEQAKGWLAEAARARTPSEEAQAFGEMQQNLAFCMTFAIWDYTPEAAAIRAELVRQKIRMGTQDMRIAAIALANNATLLTRNRRDFEKVPGLLFADWTVQTGGL